MPYVSPARADRSAPSSRAPSPASPAAEGAEALEARDRRPSRRGLLLAGAGILSALSAGPLLSACGPVQLGQPATYTPPPPGIDDLYRTDLIAQLDLLIAGAAAVVAGTAPEADDADGSDGADGADAGGDLLEVALAELEAALPVQRTALLTGAEVEDEEEASAGDEGGDSGAQDSAASAAPDPAELPADPDGLVTALIALRDLCTDAARQVSGSLARPVAAIGAHAQFAAERIILATGSSLGTTIPDPEDIVPSREVPAQDPPSIGAASDYELTLVGAQEQEWYAGYVHEVLAARSADDERAAHSALSEVHRARAEELAEIAEEDGVEVVERQAVYALPGGELDDATAAALPTQVADAVLVAHLSLVGAAPFARRPIAIAASLSQAATLSGLRRTLDAVPSLTVEDVDAS